MLCKPILLSSCLQCILLHVPLNMKPLLGEKLYHLISLRRYASARLYYLHTKLDNVQSPYYP